MASSNKKVTLDVAVKTEQENIDALDKKLDDAKRKAAELKQQKIQMKFDADTQALDVASQKLKDAENKLAGLKAIPAHLNIDVSDDEIKAAEREVEQLKQEQVNLQLSVESYKLDEVQSKKDAIEADEINVQLNNQSAMQGLEQIADGFSRIKSAASEVGQQFGDLLSSAGKQETNFAFLKNAVGDAELARQKISEINDIVAQLPGDDTALQGLLSSAAAKDSSLTASNLKDIANSATDYFSAMSFYGKSATEAQQDMTNYILAGNTAELERSPILQGHIDKLKQATTVQERSKALAEALNEEHWGGMGAMDTYNNKLETFNGMIERGRYTLGGMFQEGAKAGMDFLLKLDEGTNGLVGMTIAAGGFLSPVSDAVMGLGQMAMGINAIKETKLGEWASAAKDKISGIKDAIQNVDLAGKFNTLKTGLIDIGNKAKDAAVNIGTTLWSALKSAASAAKDAAVWLGKAAIEVLKGGWNALKAAGMWLIEKAAKLGEILVTKTAAAVQWLLNAAMSANPIMLVVIAITALVAILGYLYFNNEQVRQTIDGLGQALWGLGESIYGALMGALDWLNGAWQNTVDFLTNGANTINDFVNGALTWLTEGLQWLSDIITGSVMGAVQWLTDQFAWLNDIWNQVSNAFMTYAPLIAEILFVMATGGVGAIVLLVMNFLGMPNQIGGALQNIITRVSDFVGDLVNKFTNAASQAVDNFVNGIRKMPEMVVEELNRIWESVVNWGQDLANKFSEIGGEAYNALKRALGIGSPGYMFYMVEGELSRIEHIMENNEIPSKAEVLGENLISAWNNPQLDLDGKFSVDGEDSKNDGVSSLEIVLRKILEALPRQSGNTFQITINGDVDSDDRMDKIVTEIIRHIDWNNDTAGRRIDV